MPSSVRKINLKTSKCPLAHFLYFTSFLEVMYNLLAMVANCML